MYTQKNQELLDDDVYSDNVSSIEQNILARRRKRKRFLPIVSIVAIVAGLGGYSYSEKKEKYSLPKLSKEGSESLVSIPKIKVKYGDILPFLQSFDANTLLLSLQSDNRLARPASRSIVHSAFQALYTFWTSLGRKVILQSTWKVYQIVAVSFVDIFHVTCHQLSPLPIKLHHCAIMRNLLLVLLVSSYFLVHSNASAISPFASRVAWSIGKRVEGRNKNESTTLRGGGSSSTAKTMTATQYETFK